MKRLKQLNNKETGDKKVKVVQNGKQNLGSKLQSIQKSLEVFNDNYSSVITQTISGASFIGESLQKIAKFAESTSGFTRSLKSFMEQYQSLTKTIVNSLKPQIDIWQKWAEENKRVFDSFSEYWKKFEERYNVAEVKTVKILGKYKWFITPSFPMTSVFEIVKIDGEKGRQDKVINNLFIEYFRRDNWKNLEEMVKEWKNKPLFKKRYKILSDCVAMLKIRTKRLNEVNVILPSLIVQIDGILSDYLELKKVSWDRNYEDCWVEHRKSKVKKVGRKTKFRNLNPKVLTTKLNDLASDIFLNILFQKAQKGKPLETPFNFNRHKIIHGENVRYGRKDYLVRAFMILDFLSYLK